MTANRAMTRVDEAGRVQGICENCGKMTSWATFGRGTPMYACPRGDCYDKALEKRRNPQAAGDDDEGSE